MAIDYVPNSVGSLISILGAGGGLGYVLKSVLDYRKNYIFRLQNRVAELEAKNDANDSMCEAKLAVVRHHVGNLTSCLDAMLLIMDMMNDDVLPEKAKKAIAETKAKRLLQDQAISIERTAVQEAILAEALKGHVPAEKAERV
jgi:hypothetical protein